MKVVMVGPFGLRPKATVSRRALPLAAALARRGHAVSVLVPSWDWPADAGQTGQTDGVRLTTIALPPRLPLLSHLLIAARLVRQALAQRPDVVHCFKPKGYAGLTALGIWLLQGLRLTRARLVVDTDDWEGRGGWNEMAPYSWAQKAFFAWQERWGLTHCDAVTVASRTLQSLAWSLGVPPEKVFYLPNGVLTYPLPPPSPDAPASGEGGGEGKGEVLLYTRFVEFAVARVVDIFQDVLAQVPEARLLVVGQGLRGEEKQLDALLARRGLAGHVTFAGWVPPGDLPAHFAAADVAIFPYDDTLVNRAKCSVKLTELLAAGVPVVADRVGQNAEYIEHLVSGLLVPPGDSAAFASAVVSLLRDAALRQRLGEAARQRMQEQFTWDRLAEVAEQAYGG
jgi:glycosyltransferase involved in cell wall biosynthesis